MPGAGAPGIGANADDAGASGESSGTSNDAAADMAAAARIAEVDQQPDGAPDRQHQLRDQRQVDDTGRCSRRSPAGATIQTAGVRNGRLRPGSFLRSTSTESATIAKANKVPEFE